MNAAHVVGFVAVVAVDAWAAGSIFGRPTVGRGMRIGYVVLVIASCIAAAVTTFGYEYSPKEGIRVRGWPVPLMAFEWNETYSHWDDFVGPTLLLGYPLNLVIFMAIPSAVFVALVLCRKRRITRG